MDTYIHARKSQLADNLSFSYSKKYVQDNPLVLREENYSFHHYLLGLYNVLNTRKQVYLDHYFCICDNAEIYDQILLHQVLAIQGIQNRQVTKGMLYHHKLGNNIFHFISVPLK